MANRFMQMTSLIFQPGSHARELNPYYKDGGTGLPEENQKCEWPSSAPVLGLDANWLHKALQRAKEQAQAENKTLEEIAAQRWGVSKSKKKKKKKIMVLSMKWVLQYCIRTLSVTYTFTPY